MVVNPWGEVIARLDKDEAVISVELDPLVLEESRKKIPALQHIVL
jgi:nitrilase